MHTVNKPKMMAAESMIEEEVPKLKGDGDARRPLDGVEGMPLSAGMVLMG